MSKLPFAAALSLALVACTTHDRLFYRNRPLKGHGLDPQKERVIQQAPPPEEGAPSGATSPSDTGPVPALPQ